MPINQAGEYCKSLRALVKFLLNHNYYLRKETQLLLDQSLSDLRELQLIIKYETRFAITKQQVEHFEKIGKTARAAVRQLPKSLQKKLHKKYSE